LVEGGGGGGRDGQTGEVHEHGQQEHGGPLLLVPSSPPQWAGRGVLPTV
jgi:hypothetical protein